MAFCIFVPGIKGTELYQGDNKRWFPSTKKDLESLEDVKDLAPTSVLKEVNVYFFIKERLYSGVINEFANDSNFVPYPYDWRNSLLDEAKKFADYIVKMAEEKKTKITLVAHSMGGLLCKLAILNLQESGQIEFVKKLVTIGTPWKGAPDAFKVLEYGEAGFYSSASNALQVFNDKRTRSFARKLPSAYQLLPNEDYFRSKYGKFIVGAEKDFLNYYDVKSKVQQIYNEEHKKNPDDKVIDVWEKYIDPLHAAMEKPLPVEHDCLVGIDQPTFYTIPERKYKIHRLVKITAKVQNGDGVVPFYSAIPSHNANIYYVDALHRNQCSDSDVVNFIKWAIGDQSESQPLGIGKLRDTDLEERAIIENANLKKGVLTYILCPVETTILDKEKKYVAGVVDPSLSSYSDLANSKELQYLQMGEAKYFFAQKKEDLNFEINAYDEGIAEVGVEVFNKQKEDFELKFDAITVNPQKKAKLVIHNEDSSSDSEVKAELFYDQKKITPRKKKIVSEEEKQSRPISTLAIKATASKDTQKAAYRNTFSGAIQLSITASIPKDVEELLYSVNGKVVGSIIDKQLLDFPSGTYEIQVFGKDVLGRPLKSDKLKVSIEKEAPLTQLEMSVTPDGATISFNAWTHNAKVSTFCRFISPAILVEADIQEQWTEVPDTTKKVDLPELIWKNLNQDRNAYVTIEYYSVNEFGMREAIRSFVFSIRDLSALMWTEAATVTTAKSVFRNITAGTYDEFLDHFEVKQKIQNKVTDLDPSAKIGDNVKSVLFISDPVTIEVFYAEKYALYFSGPPTELLKVGQKYSFSFELVTERSKEKIVTTDPVARLKPMKNGIKAKRITLTQNNGVFSGSFVVDELFKEYRHKLIITDIKNITPPLRESTLMLRGEEN